MFCGEGSFTLEVFLPFLTQRFPLQPLNCRGVAEAEHSVKVLPMTIACYTMISEYEQKVYDFKVLV